MRVSLGLSLVAAMFAGVPSLCAQQAPGGLSTQSSPASVEATLRLRLAAAQAVTRFESRFGKPGKPAFKRPFVFTTPPSDRTGEQVSQQPAVVCGMTLIPADPKLDSAMRHAVPDRDLKFAIRAIVPDDCRR
jgi:hypothetical protein